MLIYSKIFVNALQKLRFMSILIVVSLAMSSSVFIVSSVIAQSDTSDINMTDSSDINMTDSSDINMTKNGQISKRGT